jgi:hypothetical protein
MQVGNDISGWLASKNLRVPLMGQELRIRRLVRISPALFKHSPPVLKSFD